MPFISSTRLHWPQGGSAHQGPIMTGLSGCAMALTGYFQPTGRHRGLSCGRAVLALAS